eukprot:Skav234712  [mRNA]  locus=scaffold634:51408:54367:+ [translate_table: standard]
MGEAISEPSSDGKPVVDLDNLAVSWEKSEDIRKHLRIKVGEEPRVLFEKELSETVKTACIPHIHALLVEMCQRVAKVPGMPQPNVLPLREEISRIYSICGVVIQEGQVIHDSWLIRKFMTFLKMKVRLGKVSTVQSDDPNLLDSGEVLTRDHQLRKKKDIKNKRKNKAKAKAKPSKKARKRGSRNAGGKASGSGGASQLKRGRKRRILKNAAISPSKAATPPPAEAPVEPEPKRTRKQNKASITESTVPSKGAVAPEPKAKAKAKAKAKPKAKAKAAAATNKSPKAAAAANPKAKAAPKTKAKRGRRQTEHPSSQLPVNEALIQDLLKFTEEVGKSSALNDRKFKEHVSSLVQRDWGKYRLNIYWTRSSCGVTDKDAKSDLHHFAFPSSYADDFSILAVSVKCAELAVTQL